MIYLYLPFRKRDLTPKLQDLIDHCTQTAKEENKDIRVIYSGEKELANLPENAEIHVLLPGKGGNISPFVKQNNISNQIARFHKSTNQHLCLRDNKLSKLIPDLADEMVSDKLFDCAMDKKISIKLFFLDEINQAPNLVNVFIETLKENKDINFSNRIVRIDHHTGSYELNEKELPKFRREDSVLAINQYYEYKSLRCCGLSGILNLNGLFSSDQSIKTINKLRDTTISDEQRFTIAQQFLTDNSDKYLAKCLRTFIEQSAESVKKPLIQRL